MVQEQDVGVVEYVAREAIGFQGILKQRYRDFLVHEVDLEGTVLHLGNTDPAAVDGSHFDEKEVKVAAETGKTREDWLKDFRAIRESVDKGIAEIQTEVYNGDAKVAGQLRTLLNCVPRFQYALKEDPLEGVEDLEKLKQEVDKVPETQEQVLLDAIDDKDLRSKLHQLVRLYFGSYLVTDTVLITSDGEIHGNHRDVPGADKVVRVTTVTNKFGPDAGGKRGRNDRKKGGKNNKRRKVGATSIDTRSTIGHVSIPQGVPPILQFVMYKENAETSDLLTQLGKQFNMSSSKFKFAGTKDKRGCTVQKVTVPRIPATQVSQAAEELRKRAQTKGRRYEVHVGNFNYVENELSLGALKGNRFVVTFRKVYVDMNGGLIAPGDNDDKRKAAKALVVEKVNLWEQRGFLNYFGMQRFGSDDVPTHKVGAAILRGDLKEACLMLLEPLGHVTNSYREAVKLFIETGDAEPMLKSIPSNAVAARCIAVNLQMRARSLKKEGKEIVSMDDYSTRDLGNALNSISWGLRMIYVHAYQSYIFNKMATKRFETYGCDKVVAGDMVLRSDMKDDDEQAQGHIVTQEEVDKGLWSITDVILPIIGRETTMYPTHEAGKEFCKKLMEEDGIDIDNIGRSAIHTAKGAVRRVLVKPGQVELSWTQYTEEQSELDFVETDADKVLGIKPCEGTPDGEFAAMTIRFTLPTSSYATMAFRELMKLPTDSAYLRGSSNTTNNKDNKRDESSSSK